MIKKTELKPHLKICPNITITCYRCDEEVKQGMSATHDCVNTLKERLRKKDEELEAMRRKLEGYESPLKGNLNPFLIPEEITKCKKGHSLI